MNLMALVAMPILLIVFLMPKYGINYLLGVEVAGAFAMFAIIFILQKIKYFGPQQY